MSTATTVPYAVVGHRGAMAEAPENTLASLRLAERLGVHELEFDIRLSADGVAVVLHDATLDRCAVDASGRGLGPVADLPYERIHGVDIGAGQRVPTFDEVLDATTVTLQVEVKALDAVDELARIAAARPDDADRIRFTSFLPDALRRLRELAPDIPRGLITLGYPDAQRHPDGIEAVLAETGAVAFYSGWEGLTGAVVRRLQDAGYEVGAWPVRGVEDVRRGLEWGLVSGTVDDPRAGCAWLEEARRQLGQQ